MAADAKGHDQGAGTSTSTGTSTSRDQIVYLRITIRSSSFAAARQVIKRFMSVFPAYARGTGMAEVEICSQGLSEACEGERLLRASE